jgi:putative chitinase
MTLQEIIKKAVPKAVQVNIDKYVPYLVELMSKYGIDTPLRQRHFLAQVLHESAGFTAVKENLNYNADALLRVFPKHFLTREIAEQYARNPEAIANKVYGNRLGNSYEWSGDGWRYVGRGLIQITGRENYFYCSHALFGDDRLVKHPHLLEEPCNAVASACWYWQKNNINVLADMDDIRAVTKRINGGYNGLEDRLKYYNTLKDL